MIFCTVNGGSKQERQLVEDAFYFVVEQLMPQKKNLDVEIWLTDMPYDDADGYHLHVEKYEHNIELQTGLIEEDLVTALFHEMVHVRQSERGQMKDKGLIKIWNGVEYLSLYSTVDEYMSLPWEAEAYKLQEELYTKWNQHHSEYQ